MGKAVPKANNEAFGIEPRAHLQGKHEFFRVKMRGFLRTWSQTLQPARNIVGRYCSASAQQGCPIVTRRRGCSPLTIAIVVAFRIIEYQSRIDQEPRSSSSRGKKDGTAVVAIRWTSSSKSKVTGVYRMTTRAVIRPDPSGVYIPGIPAFAQALQAVAVSIVLRLEPLVIAANLNPLQLMVECVTHVPNSTLLWHIRRLLSSSMQPEGLENQPHDSVSTVCHNLRFWSTK